MMASSRLTSSSEDEERGQIGQSLLGSIDLDKKLLYIKKTFLSLNHWEENTVKTNEPAGLPSG